MKNLIKNLILLTFSVLWINSSYAGTCTADTYTANSANTVLTSTKYNSDNSTIYNRLNGNLDGGCVSDGTIEATALNSVEFSASLNAITEGCKVTISDTNTVSVDNCITTVDGFNIKTIVSNTETWGCSGCSAEAAGTFYYLYIKTGSTGTTLNLLISTTAPNNDGYDSSSNKVIAKFYNNASSNIETQSIENWNKNTFLVNQTHCELEEQTTAGVANAGANSTGARQLNSKATTNACWFVKSLSSGQIELEPGRYSYSCKGFNRASDASAMHFYDVTGAAYVKYGMAQIANASDTDAETFPGISGQLSPSSVNKYELRHWTQSSSADGFCSNWYTLTNNPATYNVCSACTITKIGN